FVLPGGLSRVSPSLDSFEVSAARGGRSKDTWVLGPERPSLAHFDSMEFSPQRSVVRLSRKNVGLPSRVADNLFWLGRYTERAENLARLRRVCLLRRLENAEAHELEVLAGGSDHLSELLSTLNNIERLAGLVRDRLSKDSWRVLHGLTTPRQAAEFESQQFLELLLSGLASFWGMSNETMTRSHDWRFLRIGKRLERAVRISSLLSRTLGVRHSSEERLLEALLEMLDSMRAYRQRYPGGLNTQAALDLVLADETNPRSVAFQLAELELLLAQLPSDRERVWANPEAKLLLGCLTDIRLADVVHLCRPAGQSSRRSNLLELTSGLSARLLQMSEAINRGYLTHLDPSRQ
ncbi:MAG: circularly permuted type 2 ATP-grasp protein, partial [Candidatus Eremiobacteraeota bacterium]|nr:circularly permuted type 2 ATP-grasp protein [Candidatus Eremiobacteraeota bacterium]